MQRHAKKLQPKAKAQAYNVTEIETGVFDVVSATSGKTYRVLADTYLGGYVCHCKWSEYRDTRYRPCTHCLAVEEYRARQDDKTLSFWSTREDAQRQRRPIDYIGAGLLSTSRNRS